MVIVFTMTTENIPFCLSPLLGMSLTLTFSTPPSQKGPQLVNLICAWQVVVNISPGCRFSLRTSHGRHSPIHSTYQQGRKGNPEQLWGQRQGQAGL